MTLKSARLGAVVAATVCAGVGLAACHAWAGQDAAKPAYLPLPNTAPKGAVVLMGGTQADVTSNWYARRSKDPAGWTVDAEGVATPNKRDITSKAEFGDCVLHVEFRCPKDHGGNAGVGMQGRYEIQINGSYGKKPEAHECGAFYSQKAPIVNPSKPAGEWQTYLIIFRAPRFDDAGKVVEKARATVFQNGVLIQNNEEFNGPTGIQYEENPGEVKAGPIVLQGDHDPVQYRNIWVMPL